MELLSLEERGSRQLPRQNHTQYPQVTRPLVTLHRISITGLNKNSIHVKRFYPLSMNHNIGVNAILLGELGDGIITVFKMKINNVPEIASKISNNVWVFAVFHHNDFLLYNRKVFS